jgi:hypothetical protein
VNAKPRRIHRRVGVPRPQPCLWCGTIFTPNRAGGRGRFCSYPCRIAAWRAPKTFALITWSQRGHLEAQFRYFASRWLALFAAPDGEPFTVDVLSQPDPRVSFPSLYEIARRTRPPMEHPYPANRKGQPRDW